MKSWSEYNDCVCAEIEAFNNNERNFKFHDANYTIRLCDLITNGYDLKWNLFPIWDESYRESLVTMIQNYFWTWEIGYETEEQFRVALVAKMAEIMPKYNILFKARNLPTNPLLDHDYLEGYAEGATKDTTLTGNENKDSTDNRTINRTTDSTTDYTSRQSDTPQQNLNNLGYGTDDGFINQWLTFGEIDNTKFHEQQDTKDDDKYHHNVNNVNIEDTDTSKNYTRHNIGRKMSQQELAKQLSELAFDIESQIIQELKVLFLGLFM